MRDALAVTVAWLTVIGVFWLLFEAARVQGG